MRLLTDAVIGGIILSLVACVCSPSFAMSHLGSQGGLGGQSPSQPSGFFIPAVIKSSQNHQNGVGFSITKSAMFGADWNCTSSAFGVIELVTIKVSFPSNSNNQSLVSLNSGVSCLISSITPDPPVGIDLAISGVIRCGTVNTLALESENALFKALAYSNVSAFGWRPVKIGIVIDLPFNRATIKSWTLLATNRGCSCFNIACSTLICSEIDVSVISCNRTEVPNTPAPPISSKNTPTITAHFAVQYHLECLHDLDSGNSPISPITSKIPATIATISQTYDRDVTVEAERRSIRKDNIRLLYRMGDIYLLTAAAVLAISVAKLIRFYRRRKK
jgi:hypothetical protein